MRRWMRVATGAGGSAAPAARPYLSAAADVARSLAHDHVGTEHLLLALAEDAGGEAARALARLGASAAGLRADVLTVVGPCADPRRRPIERDALAPLGIDLDQVRIRVEAAFGPGALDRAAGRRLRVAPRLERVLAAACRGSGAAPPPAGEVLLALVAVEESVAARLLRARGITPRRVRDALA